MKFGGVSNFLFLKLFAVALALFAINVSEAQTNSVRLAVVPFFAPPGRGDIQQIAANTPDLLMVELSHENHFELVEREKVNAIWSELNLAKSGFVSADTVEKFGRILSCDWLVSGSIVQVETNTQFWVKVIDVQSSVVLDLQAFPYDAANFSATISAISDFLAQVNPHSQPRQFIALGKFADMSLSSAHGDWAQILSAMIEKHFLAAGYGVVEREAVAPIFSEFQLETAGLTADSTNRVKLKPAFWIVDGGCKWIYGAQEEVSVALRVQKIGGVEQIFRFTKPPGDELEKAVLESIQSALTNANQMTSEQERFAEASIRAAHAIELVTGHDELPTIAPYNTNKTFITITDAFGRIRQMTVNPASQAPMQNLRRETINALEQAVLLNTNDMRSKFMLGKGLFTDVDPVESQHGRDLLEEVAASNDATNALKAKNWLEDFETGRLSIKRLPLGGYTLVHNGQSASFPTPVDFSNHQAILTAHINTLMEITNIAEKADSFVQIPSPPATGYFKGITAVKFWQGKVLIASGTTLQSYDSETESTVEIKLPLKLDNSITAIETDENDLWLGTEGGGLVRIPKSGGAPRVFGERDGFPMPTITALRLMQDRLLIGFGFHESGAFGYLDTSTKKFTGLMSEVSAFKSWKDAVQNPPETSIAAINLVDETNIWVSSGRALQHFDFGSQKWNLALPDAPENIQNVSLNSSFMTAMVPMRCVAICKQPGNQWTYLNLTTNFDQNLAWSLAMDKSAPQLLWIGGNHGKVTILDMAASKIIGECKLDSFSDVKWIFDDSDRMIFIARGEYGEVYDLYSIKKSALFGTIPQTMSSVGPDNEDWRLDFLQKNFAKFVPVQFQKDANGDAVLQRLHVTENMFAFKGTYFFGFKFTVPQWLDGDFEWMYALAKTEVEKNITSNDRWGIIPENGKLYGFEGLVHDIIDEHPQLKRQLPYSHTLTIQNLAMNRLEPGKTYGIWFAVREENHPDIVFAMTIKSDRGTNEFGMLPLR